MAREQRYQAVLRNGADVHRQKLLDDAGKRESVIDGLHFKSGPGFKIRDGAGVAHIFYEIFLCDQYPKAMLKNAKTVIDAGANIGICRVAAHSTHQLNRPSPSFLIAFQIPGLNKVPARSSSNGRAVQTCVNGYGITVPPA